MMVMPANGSYPWLHYWAGRMPGSVGHLYSPGGERGPYPWLPYALDNGAFSGFNESAWERLLGWAAAAPVLPLWIAVPDVVGNAEATSQNWIRYSPVAKSYGWPLAFVVQDGHQAKDVPAGAEVVFIGGTTDWKLRVLSYWCERFSRVHVGRVNTYNRLRLCASAGAESCDGTGFGRGDKKQLAGLMQFLREQEEDYANNAAMGAAGIRRRAFFGRNVSQIPPMFSTSRTPVHGNHRNQLMLKGIYAG